MAEIDGARLWSDLMTMGAIGASAGGGSFRAALSDADREGRNLFCHWAREAGLAISIDQVGNIFARREGADPSLPPVVLGSHLDTQMPGGKFDGVYGVLAGLEVMRALNRAGVATRHPLEVACWTNEEGARFQPGLMGSSVFCGDMPLGTALAATDAKGCVMGTELARIGYAGAMAAGGRHFDSYLELHIEQGPLLEQKGVAIGAVTNSSWGCSGFVEIRGENGHSQTQAMSLRRNALVGAARLVLAIEEIGVAQEPDGMVSATVIDNLPNNRVNIPHYTRLSYAAVHATEAGLKAIVARIEAAASEIATREGLRIVAKTGFLRERLDFSPELRALTHAAATELGLSVMDLPTLTAHDALSVHKVAPVAIIFVPCRGGLSHHEQEWCEPSWATDGARVLLEMAMRRAGVVSA